MDDAPRNHNLASRRAVGTLVTGLIAVVAILGTAVFFLSNQQVTHILPQQLTELPKSAAPSASDTGQYTSNAEQTPKETSAGGSSDNSIPQAYVPTSDSVTTAQLEFCREQNIDPCTANNILARERVLQGQQSQSTDGESIEISNAHIWVNNTSSQAAFVIKNTGGNDAWISSISIRGMSVPLSKWYYNNTYLTTADIEMVLVKDNDGNQRYITVNGVVKSFNEATDPVLLSPEQAAIFYLKNPAGLGSNDAGINYTLSVNGGKSSALITVPVVTG